MCGLWGAYANTPLNTTELKRVTELGIISQLRGKDSSGFFSVSTKPNKKMEFHTRKVIGDSSLLLNDEKNQSLLKDTNPFLVAGHSRLATCGEVNEYNAHPIQESQIIGVHNGVINNYEPLIGSKNQDTDSRTLFKIIAKRGLQEAVNGAGTGAWALVYVDTSNRTLNIIRNGLRPLFYMWDKQGSCLYWASEAVFLHVIKSRGNLNEFEAPTWFEADQLYTFELGTLKLRQSKVAQQKKGWFQRGEIEDWNQGFPDDDEPDTSGTGVIKPETSMFKPLSAEEALKEELKKHPSVPIIQLPDRSAKPIEKVSLYYCRKCQKDAAYCYCDSKVQQVVKMETYPVGNPGKDMRWYRGWKKLTHECHTIIPHLKAGCQTCTMPMFPESSVMWTSATSVVCGSCLKDPMIWQYYSNNHELFQGQLVHKPAKWADKERKANV